jgi:hypothetical protein
MVKGSKSIPTWLFIIGFIIASTIYGFLTNPLGLRFALNIVAWKNPQLSYSNVQGTLLDKIHIEGLSWQDKNLSLHAKEINFQWNSSDFLKGKLNITQATIFQAQITAYKHLQYQLQEFYFSGIASENKLEGSMKVKQKNASFALSTHLDLKDKQVTGVILGYSPYGDFKLKLAYQNNKLIMNVQQIGSLVLKSVLQLHFNAQRKLLEGILEVNWSKMQQLQGIRALALKMTGQYYLQTSALNVQVQSLRGLLYGLPLKASMMLKQQQHFLRTKGKLTLGENIVHWDISHSIAWLLKVTANVDLGSLFSDISGKIKINVNTLQKRKNITFSAAINELLWKDLYLDHGSISGIFQQVNEYMKILLDLSVVQYAGLKIEHVKGKVLGYLHAHDIVLAVQQGKNILDISLSGFFRKRYWQGMLQKMNIQNQGENLLHQVKMPHPMVISWENGMFAFSQGCWQQKGIGQFCISGNVSSQSWYMHMLARQWQLSNHFSGFGLIVKDILRYKGLLNADVIMGGDLFNLQFIEGPMVIEGLKMHLPSFGLRLLLKKMYIQGLNRKVDVDGNMTSGSGTIHLKGKFAFKPTLQGVLDVIAKNAMVMNTKNTKIQVNAQLKYQLGKDQKILTGKVQAQNSFLNYHEDHNLQLLPAEVLIRNNKEYQKQVKKKYNTNFDINFAVGKHVRLDALNLKADVKGKVRLTYDLDEDMLKANGKLTLLNGEYLLNEQKLLLEYAHLRYFGGLAERPVIDLHVYRLIDTFLGNNLLSADKLTVGAEIRGDIDNFNINLYSKPVSLSFQEQLSYLLTGSKSSLNSDAIFQLGMLSRSGSPAGLLSMFDISRQLQKAFSLDELEIEGNGANKEGQGSAIVIGKRLSSKLYLRFRRQFQDDNYQLNMSYRLSPFFTTKLYKDPLGHSLFFVYSRER